jgi:hypothetical protein
VNPIRPPVLPPSNAAPQGSDAAKLAAAKAFFAAAMGQPTTPALTPEPIAPQTTAPVRAQAVSSEAPQKILRPGSLLDIRV